MRQNLSHFSSLVRCLKAWQPVVVSLLLFSIACRSEGQDYLVGIRGGTSFEKETGYFRQVDAFAGINLPWRWNSYSGLYFKPRLEASAGWISGGGGDGFIGTLGPVIELHKGKFPVTLDFGASPTVLSRYDFKQRDLGGWFQFSDHVGLDWHITNYFTVGWRFQHMSNAGIFERNPGLNLQMLSASYSF